MQALARAQKAAEPDATLELKTDDKTAAAPELSKGLDSQRRLAPSVTTSRRTSEVEKDAVATCTPFTTNHHITS